MLGHNPPATIQADRLYDLDSMIEARYGDDYAKHPKRRNLASLNNIWMPSFKTGKDEADAVKTANYGMIEWSTSEKAHIISILLSRLLGGTLRAHLVVNNEYDAQDLLRTLLVLFFDDVRDEDYVPIYAGAGSRIDFVLPQFGLAVELKYTRDSLRAKELGEQLIIDRDRYKARGGVQHLICLVFDHQGFIKNPRGIESDLGRDHGDDEMAVTVKIYDR